MMKFIIRLLCEHKWKAISPEFCAGQGRMQHYCECVKCGKRKCM